MEDKIYKRTEHEIWTDYLETKKLREKGMTYQQIADTLNKSRPYGVNVEMVKKSWHKYKV